MPSLTARIIGAVLRITGVYKNRYRGGPEMLKLIEKSRTEKTSVPSAALRTKVTITEAKMRGRPVYQISPKSRPAEAHILYFHGGGYVYPAVDVHWKFFAHLADQFGIGTTVPMYPLAPEANAIEALDFAMEVYRSFAHDYSGQFILGGDSAGGGLAAAVAQSARDQRIFLPTGIVLVCPWLDIAATDPAQPAIEPRDSILTIDGIRETGRLFADGLAVDDPRVSPIHGDWRGLPPILMFGGGDDILVTDARRLKAKLPSVDYVEEAGLMHDWPLFFLRESREAQRRIADFARELARL